MFATKEELIAAIETTIDQGHPYKYLFFWGHHPAADGRITQSCFSQWWEQSPFIVDDVTYATAEHYMMAEKARLFGDQESADLIVAATHPKQAKDLGRQAKGFNDTLWKQHRSAIVIRGNYHKFSQHDDLKTFLLQTGDRILVEASPVDPIWGIGLDRHSPDACYPAKWPGLNLLGFALMQVREQLRAA